MIERYWRNAEKCLELAQTFNDPEAKRELLGMANAWLKLAEQRVKNNAGAPRPKVDASRVSVRLFMPAELPHGDDPAYDGKTNDDIGVERYL